MFKVSGEDVDALDYISTHIDWVYQADEDGQIVYRDKDGEYTTDVKSGDIVIVFYESSKPQHPVVVINNNDWKENIKAYKDAEKAKANCAEIGCNPA